MDDKDLCSTVLITITIDDVNMTIMETESQVDETMDSLNKSVESITEEELIEAMEIAMESEIICSEEYVKNPRRRKATSELKSLLQQLSSIRV